MSRRMLIAGLLLVAACSKTETPEQASARMQAESDSARTAITALNAAGERYITGNHADSNAAMFTENGVYMPPNMPQAVGREAIRTMMTANPMPPGATIKFTIADVAANGPIAIERGTFVFTMPAMGRQPAMTMNGKYLTHWHKVNGQWMQAAVSHSDDVWSPPPPPAPAPRNN